MTNINPYAIGLEVYVIHDNKIVKTKISRRWRDPDIKDRYAYQTEVTKNWIFEGNLYLTKEDIIKDLP